MGPRLKAHLSILKNKPNLHPHPWVHHVKAFAQVNNMSYGCALSDPKIRTGYVKGQHTTNLANLNVGPPPIKHKKVKAQGEKGLTKEAKSAAKHLKFLNKHAGGDYQSAVDKRRRERMAGGGLGATFMDDLEKRAGVAGYGKDY